MTLAGGLSAKISTTRERPTVSDEQIARRTCRDYDALQRVTTGTKVIFVLGKVIGVMPSGAVLEADK